MEEARGTADKGHERLATPPTAHSQSSVRDRERERNDERRGRGERGRWRKRDRAGVTVT